MFCPDRPNPLVEYPCRLWCAQLEAKRFVFRRFPLQWVKLMPVRLRDLFGQPCIVLCWELGKPPKESPQPQCLVCRGFFFYGNVDLVSPSAHFVAGRRETLAEPPRAGEKINDGNRFCHG